MLIVLGCHLSLPSSTEVVVAPDGPWTLACLVFGILGNACVPVCSGLVPSVPPSAAACPRPHVHPRLTPSLCLSLQSCRYSTCPTENVAARCATRRPRAVGLPSLPTAVSALHSFLRHWGSGSAACPPGLWKLRSFLPSGLGCIQRLASLCSTLTCFTGRAVAPAQKPT